MHPTSRFRSASTLCRALGAGVLLATFWTAQLSFAEPLWILTFALLAPAVGLLVVILATQILVPA